MNIEPIQLELYNLLRDGGFSSCYIDASGYGFWNPRSAAKIHAKCWEESGQPYAQDYFNAGVEGVILVLEHCLRTGQAYEVPYDEIFGGMGDTLNKPDNRKDWVRERTVEAMKVLHAEIRKRLEAPASQQNEQTRFVAEQLRTRNDRFWFQPLEVDHTQYARPHPEVVAALQRFIVACTQRRLAAEYEDRGGPGGREHHNVMLRKVLEAGGALKQWRSWKPFKMVLGGRLRDPA